MESYDRNTAEEKRLTSQERLQRDYEKMAVER
jgi:hypothetical protein